MLPYSSNLKQIRQYLYYKLRHLYSEGESTSITRLIMEHTGFPSSVYLREPQLIPENTMIAQINEIVTEIHTCKPIQYILGYTQFCDLKILVNENVLIPRPETEEMIYKIFEGNKGTPDKIMDIGTGSGCMAVALKNRFATSSVTALDVSKKALEVASENALLNRLDISFVLRDILSDSFGITTEGFDLIVSNPPYVRRSEKTSMQANVLNYEPELALFVSDIEPLVFYTAISRFCGKHLLPGGNLWVEINEEFGNEVAEIFRNHGMEKIIIHKDIQEKDRFIEATRG